MNDELTCLRFIERAKKYLIVSDIVLDIGCGTGLVYNETADDLKMIKIPRHSLELFLPMK